MIHKRTGEVGSGKTLKISLVMFSNSMFAMETAQVRGSAGVWQREVAEAVSNRHPVTIAVYAGQRRENVHRRM